jgi:hypothetical protein
LLPASLACLAMPVQMIPNRQLFHAHAFEYACALKDIDHRLTKPKARMRRRGRQFGWQERRLGPNQVSPAPTFMIAAI